MKLRDGWQTPLRPNDQGEVGRVYYFIFGIVFRSGELWHRSSEFTLNPEFGRTIDKMLAESKLFAPPYKADLSRKRLAEAKLPTGQWVRMWITDQKPPPDNWNADYRRKVVLRKQEIERKLSQSPLLFDSKGGILR